MKRTKEAKKVVEVVSEPKISEAEIRHSELMTRQVLEQPIQSDSDLTGIIRVMNEDVLEVNSGLSSIDLKTRLHPFELSSILVHDSVVALGCLPKDCLITTRIKKRLAVSLMGKSREEFVNIVQAERTKQASEGFGAKIKNMFSPQ